MTEPDEDPDEIVQKFEDIVDNSLMGGSSEAVEGYSLEQVAMLCTDLSELVAMFNAFIAYALDAEIDGEATFLSIDAINLMNRMAATSRTLREQLRSEGFDEVDEREDNE